MNILSIWFDCNITVLGMLISWLKLLKGSAYAWENKGTFFHLMTWIRSTLHLPILNVAMVVKPGFYPPFTKATGGNSLSLWTLVLRSAFFLYDWKISNGDLHALVGPSSPSQYFEYSLAIAMYNVLKHECPLNVRLSAQFDFIFH